MKTGPSTRLTVAPLTPDRWPDLEAVFQARGCSIARYCWCMAYRRSGSGQPTLPAKARAQENRAALRALVDGGGPPGLVGYRDEEPVGWISLGPREEFERLVRSPVMRAVDERPVWSIVCFVVPSAYRGQGVARALLDGAIGYARERGATTLEAYPVDRPGRSKDGAMWFGAKSMYDAAGFVEVARRKPERPVVRLELGRGPAPLPGSPGDLVHGGPSSRGRRKRASACEATSRPSRFPATES